MKTISFIILLMLGSIIHAQDYYITFTGSGETATVDSIYVENLTQGTRLTLQGSDTLHLVYSVRCIKD